MKPIPLSELKDKDVNESIRCVEGVISDAFPPRKGVKNGREYSLQNLHITQGSEKMKVLLLEEKHFIHKSDIGKTIRIFSTVRGNKMLGVSIGTSTFKEVTEKVILVNRDATIELVANKESPSTQSARGGNARTSGRNMSPVETRVSLYRQVFNEVCKQFKNSPVELSPSDLKDIATHISMSYRGDYGAYAEPVFDESNSNEETASSDTSDWKSHEINGVQLSNMDTTHLKSLIVDYMVKGDVDLNHPLMQAAKSIKYSPRLAFIDYLKSIDAPHDDAVLMDFYKSHLGDKSPTSKDYLRFLKAGESLKIELDVILDDQIPF